VKLPEALSCAPSLLQHPEHLPRKALRGARCITAQLTTGPGATGTSQPEQCRAALAASQGSPGTTRRAQLQEWCPAHVWERARSWKP